MEDTQKVNSEKANTEDKIKLPFKRISLAVNRVIELAIPLHVQTLKKQYENIEVFEKEKQWSSLQAEQVNASNTIRLLKADLNDLEELRTQVKPEDTKLFEKKVQPATQDVIDSLSFFLESHSQILQPLPDVSGQLPGSALNQAEFPSLICNLENEGDDISELVAPASLSIQKLKEEEKSVKDSLKVYERWVKLKQEFSELNEIIRKFASLVFSQKENVNKIEDNVLRAHENVQTGSKYLKRALILQSATFPVTGAVVGGLLLGPVGALVGLKLFGSLACAVSGSLLGYGAGVKIKKKQQASCDIEMKSLTCASKSLSLSSPDLTSVSENATKNVQVIKSRTLSQN